MQTAGPHGGRCVRFAHRCKGTRGLNRSFSFSLLTSSHDLLPLHRSRRELPAGGCHSARSVPLLTPRLFSLRTDPSGSARELDASSSVARQARPVPGLCLLCTKPSLASGFRVLFSPEESLRWSSRRHSGWIWALSLRKRGMLFSFARRKRESCLPDCLRCGFMNKIALCFQLFRYTVFAMML